MAMLTLIHFQTWAQPVFGVKTGLHVNFLAADNGFENKKDYAGFHLGVFSQIALSKQFSFNPEVQFATRQYHLNVFGESIRMGYAEVPLLISWNPIQQLSLEAGPYAAFKLYPAADEKFYPAKAFDKTLDAGLAGGLQLHFTKNLSFIARYTFGLIPFAESKLRTELNFPIGNLEAYNRTFEVSFAWRFKKN